MRNEIDTTQLNMIMRQLIDSVRGYLNPHEYEEIIIKLGFLSWVMRKSFDLPLTGIPSERYGVINVSDVIDSVGKYVIESPKNIVVASFASEKNAELVKEVLVSLQRYKDVTVDVHVIEHLFGASLDIEYVRTIILSDFDNKRFASRAPDEIYYFAGKVLNCAEGDRMLDAFSQKGSFISYFARNLVEDMPKNKKFHHYTSVEINENAALIAKIRASILDIDYEMISEDFIELSTSLDKREFDKIYCEPPFGRRLRQYEYLFGSDSGLHRATSGEWRYILKAVNHLSEDGKFVAVVPSGLLTKHTDAIARNILLESKLIEAVINLPAGLYSNTGIGVSILVMSHNNEFIKMIDGETITAKVGNRSTLKSDELFSVYVSEDDQENRQNVSYEQIKEAGFNINPKLYANNLNKPLKNPTPLAELVRDIYRGYQLTAEERNVQSVDSKIKTIKVLTLSDIEDSSVADNLPRIKDEGYKLQRYYLEDGDVVISAKGTKIKTAVIKLKKQSSIDDHYSEPDIILPTGNLLVIRPDKNRLDPHFLCAFLQSRIGSQLMANIQTGTALVSINVSAIEKFNVPLIPYQDQVAIGQKYAENISMQKMLRKRIQTAKLELETITDSSIF